MPWARLPPEQHGSFHCLPNPANPPHNTLKVASGLHAAQHGEAAAEGCSGRCLGTPSHRDAGQCLGCRMVLASLRSPWGSDGPGQASLPAGCARSGFAPVGASCSRGVLQRGFPLGMAFPRGSQPDLAALPAVPLWWFPALALGCCAVDRELFIQSLASGPSWGQGCSIPCAPAQSAAQQHLLSHPIAPLHQVGQGLILGARGECIPRSVPSLSSCATQVTQVVTTLAVPGCHLHCGGTAVDCDRSPA